ncbi:MAG: cysteine desulfurase [Clostridia bacterium]|nr:cysteine desulfurase [Clostridia bacterium]
MTKTMTEDFGNPSSLYRMGVNAEKILKQARLNVARAINASPDEVFFTACGTESDATVLQGVWESRNKQGKRIITTAVEHPAILRNCEYLQQKGADVVYLPVKPDCTFDMDAFKAALTEDTILVSVMHVNNESGSIMPIEEIRREVNKVNKNILLHTDAVQSFEKVDTDVKKLGVDFMSISGHKVHAAKGVGALYIKNGLHIRPFLMGGGQEKGFRSGTENMPGIAGLGEAVRVAEENKAQRIAKIAEVRSYLLDLIKANIPDIKINSPEICAPSVLNISFLGCRGEVLLHTLEQDEIYVSTGSACSSHKKGSHVLTAMGLSQEEIEGAVRFSFSEENTKEQMDFVCEKLKAAVESQRRLRSAFKRR